MRLQALTFGVENIRMSRCHQLDGYGQSSQLAERQTTPASVASNRKLMCAKYGDPLNGHEMFGECFPQEILGGSPPLMVRNGRLVAV